MKKKILLSVFVFALFLFVLVLGVSATTIYKDADGNELFHYEVDENNIITTYEGEFPKVDSEGNALTWYVTATTTEGSNTVKTVASFKTLDEEYATLNENGVYTYKSGTGATNRNIVSAFFPSNMGIKKLNLSDSGYRNGYTYNPGGTEILFVYLPNTLTELPERIGQGSKMLICDMPSDMPIEKISHVAFHSSKCLREINIPDTVTEIAGKSQNDGAAFFECVSLERVTFTENSQLTTIGHMVFHKNYKLSYIKIPNSVVSIGQHAFSSTALVESPFSEGSLCTTLGGRCFANIATLESFIVPAGLTKADILGSEDYGPLAESTVGLVTFGNAKPITTLLPSFFARAIIDKIVLPEGPTNIPRLYFTCATLGDVCFSDTIETASERVFQSTYVEIIRFGANFKCFVNNYDDYLSFTNVTKGVKEIYLPASFYAQAPSTTYHVGYAFAFGSSGNNIKFFYAGTEEELNASITNFKNGTKASGTENWKFTGATIKSYEEYVADPESFASGNYIFWGYDPCMAFCTPFYTEDTVREATMVYESYLTSGLKTTVCPRCGANDGGETTPALFSCLGYSASQFGTGGVSVCYVANKDAIAEYERVTGKTVSYGVFAASYDKLGANDAVAADGAFNKCVIGTLISGSINNAFEIKVAGFANETQMNAKLILAAYVIAKKDGVGVVSYMQPNAPANGERYSYTTYNSLLKAE